MPISDNRDTPSHNPLIIHLVYICIIFAIILIAVIVCMSQEAILPSAFDNFSFAATITSIVLAVVSIYVSLKASMGTSQNLGNLSGVESRLSETASKLQALEQSIVDTRSDLAKMMTLLPASREEILQESESEAETLKEDTQHSKNSFKAIYTPDELKTLQMKAIKLAANRLNLSRFFYDYKLQIGQTSYYIDAIARKPDRETPYLMETKLFVPTKLKTQLEIFDQMLERYHQISKSSLRGVFILISPDGNDKEAISTLVRRTINDVCVNSRLMVPVVYSFSEVENQA